MRKLPAYEGSILFTRSNANRFFEGLRHSAGTANGATFSTV
jgi:hypothetical protein